MPNICFYFQVHQPIRLKHFSLLQNHPDSPYKEYFDMEHTVSVLQKVAKKCYYPANSLLLEMIKKYNFKCAFSITGIFLEQAQMHEPGIIESFKELAKTGNVEFMSETYYHSLSSLYNDRSEFFEQVDMHAKLIRTLFGQKPKIFRNTEALYSDEIGSIVENMGYSGIITEGIKYDPNYVYVHPNGKLKILMRNFGLSDDIAYRFSDKRWAEYPLTPEKYAQKIGACHGETVNLFMDYETFGEHQWADTGVFDFLNRLPDAVSRIGNGRFVLPSELANSNVRGVASFPEPISWADTDRDTSAWLGNEMQLDCFKILQSVGKQAQRKNLAHIWRMLQSSDHLYYICNKEDRDDFEVHSYFSPYKSPYDAYINYRAVLEDFMKRLYG